MIINYCNFHLFSWLYNKVFLILHVIKNPYIFHDLAGEKEPLDIVSFCISFQFS